MISNLPSISFVIFIRFFSLIVVLPTLGLYIYDKFGNNIALSFLAVGGYMFFQVVLQIPFKIMAQRLGYKGTLIVGLLLFGIGSLFCFVANDFLTIKYKLRNIPLDVRLYTTSFGTLMWEDTTKAKNSKT